LEVINVCSESTNPQIDFALISAHGITSSPSNFKWAILSGNYLPTDDPCSVGGSGGSGLASGANNAVVNGYLPSFRPILPCDD